MWIETLRRVNGLGKRRRYPDGSGGLISDARTPCRFERCSSAYSFDDVDSFFSSDSIALDEILSFSHRNRPDRFTFHPKWKTQVGECRALIRFPAVGGRPFAGSGGTVRFKWGRG